MAPKILGQIIKRNILPITWQSYAWIG